MWTAARLVTALCLAVLGYLASEVVRGLWTETTQFGWFNWVNTVIGFFCGWFIVGPRLGNGMGPGISLGATGAAALVFWGLFVQSVNEMVRLAMRHRFDGPVEAFSAIFDLGTEYGAVLLDGGFFILMIVGAIITGVLGEIAARNWR
ncbi:TrgA family protein [Salipiger mucosus]|uniref:Tellurite resistance protein n=1 Tax=Salipiger mucosus DSM 16094 TaxID=1123237 RepID=S9QFS4_9RHOB|nr:TrgA family protein [Salipiger mucosus]EPX78458.1 tellurite resistance protein [Salipiger mucosus DSM 16094]